MTYVNVIDSLYDSDVMIVKMQNAIHHFGGAFEQRESDAFVILRHSPCVYCYCVTILGGARVKVSAHAAHFPA